MPAERYHGTCEKRPGAGAASALAVAMAPRRYFGESHPGMAVQLAKDSHPSAATLAAFAIGKLPARQAMIVEFHVNACDQCAAAIAESPTDAFMHLLHDARQAQGDAGGSSDAVPHSDAAARTAVYRQRDQGAPQSPPAIAEPPIIASAGQLPAELQQHPRYRVIRLLAEGGMGAVYLAEHRVMRNLVALKTIRPELAQDRDMVERFLQEARTAGQLGHSNIARVFDAEQVGESVFLAMEYVPGKTLAQIVTKIGPLPVLHSCHYIRQITLGLDHACKKGVIHRDIKPQNVMLMTSTGLVKILDFGLGRLVDEQRSRTGLTKGDELLGTPEYVAPEQIHDARSADIRSDLYSLGCTFYYLLAGAPPFMGDNPLELLAKHETERPLPIRALRPDVPADVSDLIDRMLAKSPEDRPQSPQEIAAALLPHGPTRSSDRATRAPAADGSHHPQPPARSLGSLSHVLLSPVVLLPVVTILISLVVLFVL